MEKPADQVKDLVRWSMVGGFQAAPAGDHDGGSEQVRFRVQISISHKNER